jgi:polyisoprenyl-teichoic acid--peptidoglycan teichoic acid transferase
MEKVTEITGIYLQYYAFVSFDGFVDFVDSLGGVTIDVPEALEDPYYPDINNGFQTFRIGAGIQDLDGDMALKYARSRKTTSDFSRTLRQQQIIQ